MLYILSCLVLTWNCGVLKPDLWVVADSEAKGVVKAKFSWISIGSNSILQAGWQVCSLAHVGLWGFRTCLQQFAAQSSRSWCCFRLTDCAVKGLALLFEQLCWSGGDGCHVSSPDVGLSFLPCKTNCQGSCVTADSFHILGLSIRRETLRETTSVRPQIFSIGRLGVHPGSVENCVLFWHLFLVSLSSIVVSKFRSKLVCFPVLLFHPKASALHGY